MSGASPSQAYSAYIAQYDLAFQISPIILQGGIASNSQGELAPIVHYTGGLPASDDEVFARYLPMPGSTLISQSIGMYPFANQAVAANATIEQPLTLSMTMIAPVNRAGGYLTKLTLFSALQRSLAQHNAAGGMYIVATPAYVYENLLMTAMTDISTGDKQKQIEWQIDFIQPLLTLQAAAAAQNGLIRKITSGGKISAPLSWSGVSTSSPANLPGMTGALANINTALAEFGGSISNAYVTQSSGTGPRPGVGG